MSRVCSGSAPTAAAARPAQHAALAAGRSGAGVRAAATGDALALTGARIGERTKLHRPHTTSAVDTATSILAPAAGAPSSAAPAVAIDSSSGVIFRTDAFRSEVGGEQQSQLVHLLDAKRDEWRHQWEHEQMLQAEPWRQHKHPKPAGTLQSPWQQTAASVLRDLVSFLIMRGPHAWLGVPPLYRHSDHDCCLHSFDSDRLTYRTSSTVHAGYNWEFCGCGGAGGVQQGNPPIKGEMDCGGYPRPESLNVPTPGNLLSISL